MTKHQHPVLLRIHSHTRQSSRVHRQSNKQQSQKGNKHLNYKQEKTAMPRFSRGQHANFETETNLYSVKIQFHPPKHVSIKRPIDPAASALLHARHMRGMTGGRIEGE